jgi:hypothetical protein
MRFGRWIPLPEAKAMAPPGPGVFQLRLAAGLCLFPRGRSAMVAYGGGADLPAALGAFLAGAAGDRARARGPLLCRFAAPDGGRGADEALATLRRRFVEQFGAAPEDGEGQAP